MNNKKMTFDTAISKAKKGEFEFIHDAKIGMNEIRFQTPSGKWKNGCVELTNNRRTK